MGRHGDRPSQSSESRIFDFVQITIVRQSLREHRDLRASFFLFCSSVKHRPLNVEFMRKQILICFVCDPRRP
jgi:hypothetical protein